MLCKRFLGLVRRPLSAVVGGSPGSRCQAQFSTSSVASSMEIGFNLRTDFGTLRLYNKRHLREHKKLLFRRFENVPENVRDLPVQKYGCRGTGVRHHAYWEHIPEMVPELVVPPNLKGCKLKPYVSYRTKEIYQEPMTAKDLFNVVYGKKVLMDFKEGKLDQDGRPLDPSPEERLNPDEAILNARRTGSDIFSGGVEKSKIWNIKFRKQLKPPKKV